MEALSNEHVQHYIIKEALVKLSVPVVLAKDSQSVWEKVKRKKAQEWSRKVGRQEGGKRAAMWDRKMVWEGR